MGLLLERGGLLFSNGDDIRTGEKAALRFWLAHNGEKSLGQLDRVARLLVMLRLPPLILDFGVFGIIVYRQLREAGRLWREQFSAEESRVDNSDMNPKGFNFCCQRLHPAL